jgi:hypothetical protein
LDAKEEFRDVANHLAVERELRFFEKQWAVPLEETPKKAEQSQGTVRELVLAVSRTVRSPVLVSTDQMSGALSVHLDFQALELGNGVAQRRADAPEPGISCVRRRVPDPNEQVPAIGVVLNS